MKRSLFPALLLSALSILNTSGSFAADEKPAATEEKPSVATAALRGPLHLLQGKGGNVVASVGVDGILLVDDDYAPYAPAYQEAISALAQTNLAPSFILNTHWHDDHTGSNQHWALLGAVIFAHDNVRQRMSTRQEIAALDRVVEPSPPMALPVVTYGDAITLYFNGTDIEVQHYPAGHTDGDSVVYFAQENVVHMGDLYFKDRFPFVDLSSGGTVAGYIANVKAVLARVDDDTVIVPGHGALANREDLQRYLDMLTATVAAVQAGLDKGQTVEQVTAAGLGEQWSSWGQGFINEANWIATIASSLQAAD